MLLAIVHYLLGRLLGVTTKDTNTWVCMDMQGVTTRDGNSVRIRPSPIQSEENNPI